MRSKKEPDTIPLELLTPPISYARWAGLWEEYRLAVAASLKRRTYWIASRSISPNGYETFGMKQGPFVEPPLDWFGVRGDVIVEMPSERVAYKWKNGSWLKKSKD